MKPLTLELAVDAVADAVRALLPELVAKAIDARLAPLIDAALRVELVRMGADVEEKLDGIGERVDATVRETGALLLELRADVAESMTSAVAKAVDARVAPGFDEELRAELARASADVDKKVAELAERVGGAIAENMKEWAACRNDIAAEVSKSVATAVAAIPPAAQGERGAPGRDGRDAVFIPPARWAKARTVRAGECVQHANALWYCNHDTDAEPGEGCSGYSLMFDGAVPLECVPDERGYMSLVIRYASGRRESLPMHYRAPAYCGVFDSEREYEPQDYVTCGGSIWWARAPSKNRKPGTDLGALSWVLAVKCGRDGRDGRDGAQGPQGPKGEPGPPGRDAPKTNGARKAPPAAVSS